MIRPEAIAQAEGCVTDRQERPRSCALPRGRRLASRRGGWDLGRLREQPQGIGRAPVSQVGPAERRDWRPCAPPRAPCAPPEIAACQVDARCAGLGRVPLAPGGPAGGRGGWADPGQWPQAGGGRARGTPRARLGEPQGVVGQGIAQGRGECCALERVEASGGPETEAGGGQGIETGAGRRAPRPAARAGGNARVRRLMPRGVPRPAGWLAVRPAPPTRRQAGCCPYAVRVWGGRPDAVRLMGPPSWGESSPGNSSLRGVSPAITLSFCSLIRGTIGT
jgi:hypothetical protein